MKKKLFSLVMFAILLVCITGCGKSNEDKMLKILKENEFNCVKSSDETLCTKENEKYKKTFTLNGSIVDYEEIIYDSGTQRVVIKISDTNYLSKSNVYNCPGIINAYFKGTDLMEFYPENCNDVDRCVLHTGENVYPVWKKEYDEYKNYFANGKDKEFLRASQRNELSLSEEIRLGTIFEHMQGIKDNDMFTDNVNDALRYYEKILEQAGITLEN